MRGTRRVLVIESEGSDGGGDSYDSLENSEVIYAQIGELRRGIRRLLFLRLVEGLGKPVVVWSGAGLEIV
jgi:hypothetical protein